MKSTRLSIVEQAITDVLLRLVELPKTPRNRELRARAESYARAARGWAVTPPSEEQRGAMMKLVIDLNLEVMSEGRAYVPAVDARAEQPETPSEGQIPAARSRAAKEKTPATGTPSKGGSSFATRGAKKLKG